MLQSRQGMLAAGRNGIGRFEVNVDALALGQENATLTDSQPAAADGVMQRPQIMHHIIGQIQPLCTVDG